MLPTPTAYFRKSKLLFNKALYLTTLKSLLQTYLSAKYRLAFQMPWQAAALTPSQLFFPDGSLALLICAPVFSLALICHEASSAVLTNQKKVHLATTSTPGATTHLFRKLLLSSNGIRFSFETLVSHYLWA